MQPLNLIDYEFEENHRNATLSNLCNSSITGAILCITQ